MTEKKHKWDGKSRVSTDIYRKHIGELLKQSEVTTEDRLEDLTAVVKEKDEIKAR